MKFTKSLLGAMLMMSAAVASAANYSNTYNVTLASGDGILTGDFGSTYTAINGANMVGQTFADTFNFTLPSSTNLDAGLQSISTTVSKVKVAGVQFTSFDLYFGSNLLMSGDVATFGTQSLAGISFEGPMTTGTYSLKVDGTFTGKSGGSYSGNVNVSPVPEPESWSMLALGIAGVGFMARRRKSAV